MKRGKLIVLYGINNLGKSTQAKLLVEKLNKEGKQARYIKYPIYDLEPSGPLINAYLRGDNPDELSAREAQLLYAYNRMHFEPKLTQILNSGTNIVAEDYWGTGVAWGIGVGVDMDFLIKINKPFAWEDLALLFMGKRFDAGKEEGHLHEQDNELMEKVRKAHADLGKEYGWIKIEANKKVEEVAESILKQVIKVIE